MKQAMEQSQQQSDAATDPTKPVLLSEAFQQVCLKDLNRLNAENAQLRSNLQRLTSAPATATEGRP